MIAAPFSRTARNAAWSLRVVEAAVERNDHDLSLLCTIRHREAFLAQALCDDRFGDQQQHLPGMPHEQVVNQRIDRRHDILGLSRNSEPGQLRGVLRRGLKRLVRHEHHPRSGFAQSLNGRGCARE